MELIKFGLFELDLARRQLRKQGRRVRLQDQPLRVLEILLEHPGKLVSRQELKNRLWPADVYVDFELGLNSAIKRLRLALDDSADNPIFIQTVPKSGYRFLAPIEKIPIGQPAIQLSASATPSRSSSHPLAVANSGEDRTEQADLQPRPRWMARIVPGFVVAAVVLTALYALRPLSPPLQVTRIVNLTKTGLARPQESLLSDGARIYYSADDPEHGVRLRQILLNGGEETTVEGLPPDSLVRDLSPDHTTFLSISAEAIRASQLSALYAVPVVGGPLHRVGNFLSDDAAWSPDGANVAFADGTRLFVGRVDGSGRQALANVPGQVAHPHWSPDGMRLRFTVIDAKNQSSLWEVRADGTGAHQLDFHWSGPAMESHGRWSADGRYYFFNSLREGVSNLFVVEEKTDWLHRPRVEPVRLTAGPISFVRPLPSPDGSKLFALGTESAGELLRYDPAKHDFVQFLKGLGADQLNFSGDGNWIAYISFPEGTLWRTRSDGTERLQLTQPPLRALNPRWSPDGKRILFVGRVAGELPKLYTIEPEGGKIEAALAEPHAQTSAAWSPDGGAIFYGRDPDGENQDIFLYRFDVKSGRTEKLPNSEGLFSPNCSPDGRSLTAQVAAAPHQLFLYDLASGRRTVLSKDRADYPAWSADSRYVYFNTLMYRQRALFRLRVADATIEKITNVPFLSAGMYGFWSGLAPDGSILVLRSHVQTDVYSLSLH